ncbi:MBL fold metallo-hydrolase [Pseudophaeobacter sp.]|jgi:ribonuclease BN (tRNA processing enzyme)|uniref:MBL fold metallo-hydrolase n=1 Tax=Pseudophaeobacter sp. TaxID=1971739 RepID=UPI0025CC8F85|nr:MBL fold metallo-hydrolase [uncultured Pseudophaeobacter sp.]
MKLTILGSGSPEAYARRASSGYLLEVGEDVILFDCGGGVFDNLLRSGRKPSDITHLFFTHYHSDHMMDYARLVHAAVDSQTKCKFFTKTESCTEDEEWEPTTVT